MILQQIKQIRRAQSGLDPFPIKSFNEIQAVNSRGWVGIYLNGKPSCRILALEIFQDGSGRAGSRVGEGLYRERRSLGEG
jgi:hypothetical protein